MNWKAYNRVAMNDLCCEYGPEEGVRSTLSSRAARSAVVTRNGGWSDGSELVTIAAGELYAVQGMVRARDAARAKEP